MKSDDQITLVRGRKYTWSTHPDGWYGVDFNVTKIDKKAQEYLGRDLNNPHHIYKFKFQDCTAETIWELDSEGRMIN